jgi:head-tail adaptor
MTVNIGELKHRVTFWQESNVSDGQGGYVTTWSQLANAWAKVDERSTVGTSSIRERFYRGLDSHTQLVVFTIRQPQTFTLDTRTSDKLKIVHRGISFRIIGISRNKFNLDFYDISAEQWGAVTQ